ncbi:MAG: DNA polymerase III subunit delta' [Alphaproteobacteria bacterium]|nr:DNA polymerase III subunit delta' [Alphaproteobacteria bacterium]
MTVDDDEEDPFAPRRNLDLVGQEAAERTVLDAWNAGRMPHAWLITGPRGVGKATLAYRIARFALAGGGQGGAAEAGLFGDALPPETPQTLAIAPNHPVVARVASRGHADLRVLEPNMPHPVHGRPTREIVVGNVWRAVQLTNLTSAEAGWRVILIDPADELNATAQNAILKRLEEPPPGVLFLLVSHAPGRLLPTIRSRCRRVALEPLGPDAVDTLLGRYRPELPEDDRRALGRLTEGSVGDAQALADSGGLDLYRNVVRLLGTLDSPDIQGIHALGDSLSRAGQQSSRAGRQAADGFATVRDLIGRWLGRLVIAGARAEAPLEIVPGEAQISANFLSRAPLEQWLEVWEKVTGLLARADGANLDRKQTIVSAFLTMAAVLQAGQRTAR